MIYEWRFYRSIDNNIFVKVQLKDGLLSKLGVCWWEGSRSNGNRVRVRVEVGAGAHPGVVTGDGGELFAETDGGADGARGWGEGSDLWADVSDQCALWGSAAAVWGDIGEFEGDVMFGSLYLD